ncbi:unnamed protein product, partial [marine sediment metagenome]
TGLGGFTGSGGMWSTTVDQCYSNGTYEITNSTGDVGGFGGWGGYYLINNSYTVSTMSGIGVKEVGFMTLTGWGGINSNIYNSYSASTNADGSGNCGFACGTADGFGNNYWNNETIFFNDSLTNSIGTAKTNYEMGFNSTYTGFNFGNVWQMTENVTYPYFIWQSENIPLWTAFDTDSPIITIYSPENITYSSQTGSLNVSANEIIDIWSYTINSGSIIYFIPNSTYTAVVGSNNLTVYANDSEGNIGSETVYFTYTPPIPPPPPPMFVVCPLVVNIAFSI